MTLPIKPRFFASFEIDDNGYLSICYNCDRFPLVICTFKFFTVACVILKPGFYAPLCCPIDPKQNFQNSFSASIAASLSHSTVPVTSTQEPTNVLRRMAKNLL